jgi:hypothetical protein
MVAATATCLMMGVAVPAASAAGAPKAQAAASKAGQAKLTAESAKRNALAARRTAKRLGVFLSQVNERLKGAEGGVALLLGAAPQLVDGLQRLRVAVQDQIAPGLQQLATAVQTQIAPGLQQLASAVETQIVPNLTRVGTYATAQEYGVTRVFTGPNAAGPALPITVPSADIPDDGNGVSASGEIPISVGGGGVPAGTLLTLRSAIRSGEADGNATGDPAGQVGGLLTMTCGSPDGDCDVVPGAGEVLVPAGAVVCIQGPPPAQTINLPGGGSGSFPVVTIQNKAPRVGVVQPTASDPNPGRGRGPLRDPVPDQQRRGRRLRHGRGGRPVPPQRPDAVLRHPDVGEPRPGRLIETPPRRFAAPEGPASAGPSVFRDSVLAD